MIFHNNNSQSMMMMIQSQSYNMRRVIRLLLLLCMLQYCCNTNNQLKHIHSFLISPKQSYPSSLLTINKLPRLHSTTGTIQEGPMEEEKEEQQGSTSSSKNVVVIISPPGGIGEIIAVKNAQQGYNIKWLVITSPSFSTSGSNNSMIKSDENTVSISQDIYNMIQSNDGTLQIASIDAKTLLLLQPQDQENKVSYNSASQAISTWCTTANTVICTLDGVEKSDSTTTTTTTTATSSFNQKQQQQEAELEQQQMMEWKNAIYMATKEVVTKATNIKTKIAILSSFDDDTTSTSTSSNTNSNDQQTQNLFSQLSNPFNSNSNNNDYDKPKSLLDAIMTKDDDSNNNQIIKIRHGQLFGLPESSKDFTPFINGPKRIPELCEEYTMRTIRIDPTNTISGNAILRSKTTRTSRHVMGDAITTILNMIHNNHDNNNNDIDNKSLNMDIFISSQPGIEPISSNEWQNELQRVLSVIAKIDDNDATTRGIDDGIVLFTMEYGSVPDKERLTDWITTKWAPAVLRTYDIAAIRTGARPVYANKINPYRTEIIWQQLINFQSVIVGRMIIDISDTSMIAIRGGPTSNTDNGTTSTSRVPLPGEDILIRRLAEAATQAIEKGLATKVRFLFLLICLYL
jgi:hypothetical protein